MQQTLSLSLKASFLVSQPFAWPFWSSAQCNEWVSLSTHRQLAREHWTQLLLEYLTRMFKELRDESGVVSHLKDEEKPTFHEIRSLGGRLLEHQGWEPEKVQLLYRHTDVEMTRHSPSDGIKWVSAEGANFDPESLSCPPFFTPQKSLDIRIF